MPSGPLPPEPVSVHAPALTGPVLMNQDWRDLTFLHWALPVDRVAHLVPPGVRPDVHEGATYVGLVPFRMVDAGLGRRSTVPWAGTFLETNVRLYSVDDRGRRGVVFLSLDASRLPVVLAARAGFGVPYRWARMGHHRAAGAGPGPVGEVHTYTARLRHPGLRGTRSRVVVRVGARRGPTPLDRFVSARWRLHTSLLGRGLVVPNAHEPWPLHDLEVVDLAEDDHGLLASVGLADLAHRPPDQAAFSPGVHTLFGLPRR